MKRFLLAASGFYLLAAGLGLALRLLLVRPFGGLDFANAVHAHSHTLYFGWAGLAIASLAFERIGARDRAVRAALSAIAAVAAATFVAFLHSGYRLPGMVVSGLALVVWAATAALFFRRARGVRGVDVAFLRAGFAYAAIAVAFAAARVVLVFSPGTDPLLGRLAVFGFLHDFAWFFVLGAIGLLAGSGPLGSRLSERELRLQLRLTVPVAWLTFPLGVVGASASPAIWPARAAALWLLVPAFLLCRNLLRARRGPNAGWLLAWFGAQAALEAAGALGLAEAAVRSRHLAMLYLHVLLLGFVTHALWTLVSASRLASALHGLGLLVMAAGLALAGAGGAGVALPDGAARLGLALALAGGAISFAGGIRWAAGLSRSGAGAGTVARASVPAG